MSLPACRAILFDLDGTLVDTAPDLGHAADLCRAERGLPPLPVEQYRPVASAGARGLLRVALGIAPEDADYEHWRGEFLRHYREHLARASHVFDGIDAVLRLLEGQGRPWGVVTNKPSWLTRPLLDQLALAPRAACAISADEVPRAKPAPDALLLACARLGLPPADCIYVGDDLRDIRAGQAAGMPTAAAGWGYLGEDGPVGGWGADLVLADVAALDALVRATGV